MKAAKWQIFKHVTCMCGALTVCVSVCFHVDYEWTVKSHAFVRGCRMIHLAVLLPAAVSSNLIRREGERGSISFSSSTWVVYESTNCLFDCLNKWHKANASELSALCQMVWLSALCTFINYSQSSHSISLLCKFSLTKTIYITCLDNKSSKPIKGDPISFCYTTII